MYLQLKYMNIQLHTYTNTYIYIHSYIPTYIHTYIHIDIYTQEIIIMLHMTRRCDSRKKTTATEGNNDAVLQLGKIVILHEHLKRSERLCLPHQKR